MNDSWYRASVPVAAPRAQLAGARDADVCIVGAGFTGLSAALELAEAGRKVFLLVSGGVDSSVAFLLLNQALGEDRVLGLHIDNGFMRKGETALVERLMKDSGFHNLQVVDASADFLRALEGVGEVDRAAAAALL